MPLLEQLSYKITAYNTRHQRGRKLSVGGVITPIFVQLESTGQESLLQLLLPNPELTTVSRGENIDFRPPVYTLVGHEICKKRSLSSIELRIELSQLRIESRRVRPLRTLVRVRSPYQGLLSETGPLQPLRASTAPPRPRKPHTLEMKKREKREPQARSSEDPVEWSAPDGRLPSPDHDLASQFFGGH
ncbi:unnamed protein product [Microthlaspi erraticum]|uniref:Uncharacterized protein n=1 Tax=Microthlaspi erraticum TaxID=1685480 RepID=A0A6D2L8U8_9BRAS|nr:unnamed protein product [Microthlaspi erraticum]